MKRLLVCVGPGGVGKTTVAASLGVSAAVAGHRSLVLTIDPAKRLASALGLDGLSDAVVPVSLAELDGARGSLHAAMLDTQSSFDSLIERTSTDRAARDRILDNRVYRAFSRTLARSHAYVASERLYDVATSGDYDVVILDSPPTRSALDILDAPGRLLRFLDSRTVRFLVGASGGKAPRGASMIMGLLSRAIGASIVEELSEFLSSLFHLRDGFHERASYVVDLLGSAKTDFVMVAACDPVSIGDASYLRDGLVERGVRLRRIVFNRSFIPEPSENTLVSLMRPVDEVSNEIPRDLPDTSRPLVLWLRSLRADLALRNREADRVVERFCAAIPGSPTVHRLPMLDKEPCDIRSLAEIAPLELQTL